MRKIRQVIDCRCFGPPWRLLLGNGLAAGVAAMEWSERIPILVAKLICYLLN